jgi:double-stranded uracil-DNA glycosylase
LKNAESILPDILGPMLKVVFCGTAAGAASAKRGAYYAGPGNKFWQIIHKIGLTDRVLKPEEYPEVLRFGIGLTDVAKLTSGADSTLRAAHFDKERLHDVIIQYRPRALAFNGKKAAQVFLQASCDYGRQTQLVGTASIYVLPSTSGAANGYWNETSWYGLARDLRGP